MHASLMRDLETYHSLCAATALTNQCTQATPTMATEAESVGHSPVLAQPSRYP